jgi:hypothetical protein
MKKLVAALVVIAVVTTLSSQVKADGPNGEFGFVFVGGGTGFSSSSFAIPGEIINDAPLDSGDLANATLQLNTTSLGGLSTSGPTVVNANDFLTLTTTTATYQLNISSFTVTSSSGVYQYLGTGSLVGASGSSPTTIAILGGPDQDVGSVVLNATADTPEPSTWALLVGSLGVLVLYQRRQRRI